MNFKIWTILLDIFSIVLILISAYIAVRGKTFDDRRKKSIFKKVKKAGWYFIFLFILGNGLQYASNYIKSNNEIELLEKHKQELLDKHNETVNLELEIAQNTNKSFQDLDSINNQLKHDNDTLKSELKHLRVEYIAVLNEYNNSLKDKNQNIYINFQSEIRLNRSNLVLRLPLLSYNPRFIPDFDITNDASKKILDVINNQHLNRYIRIYIEKIDDFNKSIIWADDAQKNRDSIKFNNHKENIEFLVRQIHKQEKIFECSFSKLKDIDEFSISEKFIILYNDSTMVCIPISTYCDDSNS